MRPRSDMLPYQEEAVRLAVERRRLALLLAPGDGKTVVALTALREAGALPALVVAPRLVVEADVWGEEARAWEHLAASRLRVRPVVGTPRQRHFALAAKSDVYVVSYENLLWLTDELEDLGQADLYPWFRGLVFDEVSKMKHAGTRRFRRVRARGMRVPFRLGLTGSPVGNHLLDLWGEMFVVAGAAPLGPTFSVFKEWGFQPYDYYQRVWGLKGMRRDKAGRPAVHTSISRQIERAIQERVAAFSYVRPPGRRRGVPPVREVARRAALPPQAARVEEDLRRHLWAELPSGAELEALSRSAVAQKVRQLAGGAVYARYEEATEDEVFQVAAPEPEWEEVHGEKLRLLDDLLDELQGEPLLVYYWYRHELERLGRLLDKRRWRALDDAGAISDWNARRLEVLLAHPQSGGFGLNLQAGGHHAAWFTLPWSRELYDQGCGRLARLGQRAPEVTSHLLLCGQVDEDVWRVVARKGDTERRLLEAARRRT